MHTFSLSVCTGWSEPIYSQIVGQVKRRIASGAIRAGQEIPSVREVARALAIHPMTISKAYGILEADGLLERRRGLSMVVSAKHTVAKSEGARTELLRPTLHRAAAEARELRLPAALVVTLFGAMLADGLANSA